MKRNISLFIIAGITCIISFFFTGCQAKQAVDSIDNFPVREEVAVSVRLFEFTKDNLEPWINGITHLRAFGIDFNKPKDSSGLLQYVDDQRVDDFIEFSNTKELKIIWTLNVSSFTLQSELDYVGQLIKKGLNIVAFEYGGEFYLPKYYNGDLSNQKVMEQIRMDGDHNDYLAMLDQWIPAFTKKYPPSKYEHILVCASHSQSSRKRDQYRRLWNDKVFSWAEQYNAGENKFSFSYHLYAGANRSQGPADEEDVLQPSEVDWSFLNDKPQGGRWVATESGYYISSFSETQLTKARQFYQAESEALGPDNLFGIHTLTKERRRVSPLTLYNPDGITPVGKNFEKWLMKNSTKEE